MKSRNTLLIAIVAMFALALTTAQSAVAVHLPGDLPEGHMYAMGRTNVPATQNNSTLLTGTIAPFSVSTVGEGVGRFAGIDFQPGTNVLFASSANGDPGFKGLYTIDIATGASTQVGAFGTGAGLNDLAFGTDGTLYGTDNVSLFEISTTTGEASLIGDYVSTTQIEGIAVDPTTGILYGIGWQVSDLYSIDTGSGVATLLGDFADLEASLEGFEGLGGLGSDLTGTLYATVGSQNGGIYALDRSTFTSTFIGDGFAGSVSDIAFSAIPEPTGIALALLGLTFCTRIRRVSDAKGNQNPFQPSFLAICKGRMG